MSSLGSILSIARSAIAAHQTAVQVSSQNISNAQTEGFSRQRATLVTGTPARGAAGSLGTGVVVRDITRVRDTLLDTSYRREAGNAAGFGLRRDLLGQVEEIFGGLSEGGFGATLDAFWSSWSDLANNPGNGSVRGLVQQRGEQVAFALNNFAERLEDQNASTGDQVARAVGELNDLARQAADLNRQIAGSEHGGHTAPDLRDQRDRVIDRMSRIAPVRVIERSDGSTAVIVANATMVDGADTRTLRLDAGSTLRVGFVGSVGSLTDIGGSLGAMLEVRNTEIPEVQAKLDALASGLATAANEVHVSGTGVPFFDGSTAAGIRLGDAVASDPSLIGASSAGPGDNRVALEMAALRHEKVTLGTSAKTLGGYYADVVTDVAVRVGSADNSATVYEILASQADTRRSSVSGVSVDEELIQMIRHQQAYSAATRLVNVADEMVQSILNMV